MRKFVTTAFVCGTLGLVIGASAHANPVTFSFFETGITACNKNNCEPPPSPQLLATLTLPSETSSGTADLPFGGLNPTFTGDGFLLTVTRVGPPVSQEFGSKCAVV